MEAVLAPGELVVLHDRLGRRHALRLQPGAVASFHNGSVRHDDLLGRPEGTIVSTSQGSRLVAFRPTFAERVVGRRRTAQPIYPKDIGAILLGADISPGDRVLEAGTGTGALTAALVRAVGERGRVVSYEVRAEFAEAARGAIEAAVGSLPPNLELHTGDLSEATAEVSSFDKVCLDLPQPWAQVQLVRRVLRPGGIVFVHCPNISQTQRFADSLRECGGFGLMETIEVLQRAWAVRERSLRPVHRMVAHSGFLSFARRLAGEGTFETEAEGF